jgi:DNA-binding protein Fis
MTEDRPILKIAQMQKRSTEHALAGCDGNRTKAAEVLGVSVRTVRNWIKKYGLSAKYPYRRGRQK